MPTIAPKIVNTLRDFQNSTMERSSAWWFQIFVDLQWTNQNLNPSSHPRGKQLADRRFVTHCLSLRQRITLGSPNRNQSSTPCRAGGKHHVDRHRLVREDRHRSRPVRAML
jgi:hypothetical protein